jgi:cobalt/nickel transport system ATP-binding protein
MAAEGARTGSLKAVKPADGGEAVRLEGVTFSYPDGTPALRGVSLLVGAGDSVALVGPNGAGKSTLLLHLNGTLASRDGRSVRICGAPLTRQTLREARRKVGVVFQDPDDQLFCPTVFDDVAFGPLNQGCTGDELTARVRRALEAVGIPPGLQRRAAHNLSFGERRRVAIATVLSMDAEILALDEPSSNLDPASRRELIRLLTTLPQTKIVATHDLELALETCARAVLLDAGRVVTEGPCRSVLSDAALMGSHRLEVPLSLRGGRR